jgi:hypothetical protein
MRCKVKICDEKLYKIFIELALINISLLQHVSARGDGSDVLRQPRTCSGWYVCANL